MAGLPFTLRQLEIFGLLCDLGSFRLTSEKLGISQASVSNQLKALERQLGLRLLSPEHRNVALLHRLEDWRLTFYRNPRQTDPRSRMAEEFLISAVLDDPSFPIVRESDASPAGD